MGVLMGFGGGLLAGDVGGQGRRSPAAQRLQRDQGSDEVMAALQGAVRMGQQLVNQALSSGRKGSNGGLAGIASNPIVRLIASGAKDLIGRRLAA